MTKDPLVYLTHIFGSCQDVMRYTVGVTKKEFKCSQQIQDAVLRRLEIIGEAAKQLPDDIRQKKPVMPWKQIAGMRDKLIHEYFSVDLDLVWVTVKKDIPKLAKHTEGLLKKNPKLLD